MPGIFISYRRQDSQSAAGRLADHLREHLPQVTIFRDVETIEPGVDFVQAIEKALASCGVMLVVIGPRWLTVTDAAGRRRLDDPRDYTRLEAATALGRESVRVIPVLVEGATMPAEADLPEDLRPLCRRNAIELTDKRWEYDVSRLVETVRKVLGVAADAPRPWSVTQPAAPPLARALGRWTVIGGVLLLAVAGYLLVNGVEEPMPVPGPEMVAGNPNLPAEPSSPPESGQQAEPPPAVEPVPTQPFPPQLINLTGLWQDDEGGRHQIAQQGNRIAVQGVTPDGIVHGAGELRGRTGWVEYTLNGYPLRAALEVAANGEQMRVVVVDAATGERDVLTMHRIQ